MKVEIIVRAMKSEYCPDLIWAVDYGGKTYGGGSPCRDNVDIDSAIARAKKDIARAGDNAFVTDCRIKQLKLF